MGLLNTNIIDSNNTKLGFDYNKHCTVYQKEGCDPCRETTRYTSVEIEILVHMYELHVQPRLSLWYKTHGVAKPTTNCGEDLIKRELLSDSTGKSGSGYGSYFNRSTTRFPYLKSEYNNHTQ